MLILEGLDFGYKFLNGVLSLYLFFGVIGLEHVIEHLLTNLVCILLIKVVDLQLSIMAILMKSLEAGLFLSLDLLSLGNEVPEEVSPGGFTVTRPLLHHEGH